MIRLPKPGALCLAAALATGVAGTAYAVERTDVQRYRQMLETYRADPLGQGLDLELATLNATIAAAEGYVDRDQDDDAERTLEQLDAQVGLIEARLALARAEDERRRAEVEFARTRNQIERAERTVERLEAHRARLERQEG